MGKWRRGVAALCVAILTLPGTIVAAPAGGGVIRFGTEAAFPPLNFVGKNGRLTGFDVDIGNAICEAVGATCEWVVSDWDGLVDGLEAGRFDAVLSSMPITDEALERVDFTDRYHLQPAAFAASESHAGLEISKETLMDKSIGVVAGSAHEAFVTDNFGDIADVRAYELLAQATVDLVDGRLDLVFADRIVLADGFLKTEEGKAFRLIGPSYTDPEWFGAGAGIAVRKGDLALRFRLNRALKTIRENGTYKKINDRYFDFDVYGS